MQKDFLCFGETRWFILIQVIIMVLRPNRAFMSYWVVLGGLKAFNTSLKYNYLTVAMANMCLYWPNLLKHRFAYPYLAIFSLTPLPTIQLLLFAVAFLLPKPKFMCPICLETIDHEQRHETPCAHSFHIECLGLWTEQKNTCPTCRQPL